MSDSASREQQVLAELERLQAQIEAARRRRREASDEFDAWVRSFRGPARDREHPEPPPSSGRMASALRANELPRTGPRPDPGAPGGPPRPSEPPAAETFHRAPPRWGARAAAAAIAAVVICLLLLAWFRDGMGPREGRSAAALPAAGPPPASAPAVPAVREPAAVPPAELITERRVWVRVLVDGERAFERELDANVRIPLRARDQITVRAGDAGAVRIAIAGRDQGLLGRDGVVVTRTFDLPR